MATILIADDDKYIRELYQEVFTEEGYRVVLACDGHEALRKVEEETPDLVVLDIKMPGMDGIEALGKMLSKHKKLPVILNTAYPAFKDDFMSWAADAYITKSHDLTELKTAVKSLLEERKEE